VNHEGKTVKNFWNKNTLGKLLDRDSFVMIDAPDLLLDLRRELVLGEFQVIGRLKIHLVTRAGVKIAGQTQGGVGSYSSPLANNLGDTCDGNTQIERQPVHAQSQWLGVFVPQNFIWMDRRQRFLRRVTFAAP
jgi:hypothetical protein